MTLKQSDIEALVTLFSHSSWDEMHVEIDGEEIFLSNDSRARQGSAQPTHPSAPQSVAPAAQAAPAAAPAAATTAAARPAHWIALTAPNLGTFYRAPSPEAAPYVTVGASVTPETEVCLIEVMKLFTTVRAGVSGIVREIAPEDGQMVEYGDLILWIEPV